MFVKSPNFMVVVCVEVKWFTVFCFHVFPRFRKGFYLSHCVSCGVLLAWQFAELHLILWCKVPFKISSTIWLICVVSFFLFKNQNTHNVQIFCWIFLEFFWLVYITTKEKSRAEKHFFSPWLLWHEVWCLLQKILRFQ